MRHWNTTGNLREQKTTQNVVHIGPEAVTPSFDEKESIMIVSRLFRATQAAKAATRKLKQCTQDDRLSLPNTRQLSPAK